ncbi:MAG TPA: PP2C family protein-serine/threonine phosphatase [Thermoanaerobaculia bacterium]|nr:PP2C family protein-serine/threonine phosphatase [Thermoanaerobaculia bacterium]
MDSRKSLFRKVERAIEAIERSSDASSTIAETASAVIENFKDELGVTGGRLYERRDGGYELTRVFGGAVAAPGIFVPDAYPPVQQVVDEGVVLMDLTAPGVDPEFERKLGVDRFAAIAVGEDQYILSFSVDPVAPHDDLMASLGILRHAVDQKLREERFLSVLIEARQIQMSILPKRSPRRGEFEIAGFTVPAEIVGGDFFDFIPVTDRIQGIAIADASGHGLPAALQVRDVYTGLRMGVARDFKIVRTVERLNRIIHESRMTTKFVSLFYGEVEADGNLIYVNAGHPPPLHFHAKGVTTLKQTGLVLGPSATATYSRGFLSLEPGDALLLFTDGMIEATDPKGREFGVERLKRAFLALRERSSDDIVRALVEKVGEYACGRPAEDDRTVVVVKRPKAERDTRPIVTEGESSAGPSGP